MVDTGPDFRQQMLRKDVVKLDAVLFTHEHRDHIAGLDDIRAFNFLQRQSMDVFAEKRVFRALKGEFPYVFAEKKYPGVPQINEQIISSEAFSIGNMRIIPIRLMHYRLPILGFRINDFAYLTDCNYISEEEKEKLIGVKHLVINALRREKHISHFTLSQALELIEELSPQQGYITHISHQMEPYEELVTDVPASVIPAYDGLELDL